VFADASYRLGEIAIALAKERRDNPTDDLMSWVSQASYEGQKMTVEEVGVFFALLAGASNDTTRHAMGHVLWLFQQHPDQLAWLFEDFEARIGGHVNELLRYEDPDHALPALPRRGHRDQRHRDPGRRQKWRLWYIAGNRDPEAFPDPERFDITRPAVDHLAFGGGGPHYCIGHLFGPSVAAHADPPGLHPNEGPAGRRPTHPAVQLHERRDEAPASWTPGPRA